MDQMLELGGYCYFLLVYFVTCILRSRFHVGMIFIPRDIALFFKRDLTGNPENKNIPLRLGHIRGLKM